MSTPSSVCGVTRFPAPTRSHGRRRGRRLPSEVGKPSGLAFHWRSIDPGRCRVARPATQAGRGWRKRSQRSVQRERAKDPGLGVRGLHAQGLTGSGVAVAIIDGKVRRDHVEYADRLRHYEELDDFSGLPFEMHGPAMASLLVGRSVGVAPGAELHYFAVDFARLTPERLAMAIDHVVDRNRTLPHDERVRLLSASTGYRDEERTVVDAAIRRAIDSDVFVLLSVYPLAFLDPPLAIRGLGCSPWRDCRLPEAFTFSPGEAAFWRAKDESVADVLARRAASDAELGYVTVYAPAHHRTVAGHHHARHYRYDVEGGDSQWAPYLVGVLALALQVAPELHASDLAALLAAGAEHGDGLIVPARMIELARAQGAAGASSVFAGGTD